MSKNIKTIILEQKKILIVIAVITLVILMAMAVIVIRNNNRVRESNREIERRRVQMIDDNREQRLQQMRTQKEMLSRFVEDCYETMIGNDMHPLQQSILHAQKNVDLGLHGFSDNDFQRRFRGYERDYYEQELELLAKLYSLAMQLCDISVRENSSLSEIRNIKAEFDRTHQELEELLFELSNRIEW